MLRLEGLRFKVFVVGFRPAFVALPSVRVKTMWVVVEECFTLYAYLHPAYVQHLLNRFRTLIQVSRCHFVPKKLVFSRTIEPGGHQALQQGLHLSFFAF